MRIELTVIEDLGIKLYGKLPPVISEIVANAWDADAKKITISIPEGEIDSNSVLQIEDDGMGMTYDDIKDKYLRIGRKKREEEKTDQTPGGRSMMGSKGIGKLSVFGVSKVVEVHTTANHRLNSFRMDIVDILKEARTSGIYHPEELESDKKVEQEHGTMILLSNLKRSTSIPVDSVRRNVAKHFSVIGDDFQVIINNKPITSADKYNRDNMAELWEFDDEVIDEKHPNWKVNGWIGTTANPLEENERGVVIMARGKLLQTPTTFDTKVGSKFSYSYMIGEINAEFLDDKEDLIATNRQSLIWESAQGDALKAWGNENLKRIADQWAAKRKAARERVIRDDPEFKNWLDSLERAERRIADRVIGVITSSETISDERRKDLARFMMESFDHKVFHEMVGELGDNPDPVKVLEVFHEWDVIEAREILRMVKGRMSTIGELQKLIDTNAKEVPTIHNFFKDWPWILEPTWTRWQDEVRYSKLLHKKFPDDKLDESDRRIDFVCIGVGDTINVIELKRPGYSVKSKDFDQLIDYQEFVRENLGTDRSRGYNDVAAYIVAGKMQTDRVTSRRKKDSENSRVYVKRYEDLIVTARQLHAEFEERLDEFEKARKRDRKKS